MSLAKVVAMPRKRILIVDDEDSVRNVIASLLERSYYETTAVASAEAAMSRLQQDPDYDLVLSDIVMPGTDGLKLLDQISADYPAIPVVLFSGINDTQVTASAFRRGAIDYLLKPFDHAELENVAARAIEHGRLRKQNAIYLENLKSIVSSRTGRLRSTMQDLERSYDITLEAMGDALDLRDEETEGHSRRVTAYTIALARAMDVGPDELRTIARGAFLHDIGKIAIPDRVLLKKGKLTRKEYELMKRHPIVGDELCATVRSLDAVRVIVRHHHERLDGGGYPDGLAGDRIPLLAQIVSIVDVFDALTTDRPYRHALPVATAYQMMRDNARAGWCRDELLTAFIDLHQARQSPIELRVESIARIASAAIVSVGFDAA